MKKIIRFDKESCSLQLATSIYFRPTGGRAKDNLCLISKQHPLLLNKNICFNEHFIVLIEIERLLKGQRSPTITCILVSPRLVFSLPKGSKNLIFNLGNFPEVHSCPGKSNFSINEIITAVLTRSSNFIPVNPLFTKCPLLLLLPLMLLPDWLYLTRPHFAADNHCLCSIYGVNLGIPKSSVRLPYWSQEIGPTFRAYLHRPRRLKNLFQLHLPAAAHFFCLGLVCSRDW